MSDRGSGNRRQFERLPIKESVYLAFRPYFKRLGLIKDISRDGIAFEYSCLEESEEPADPEVEVEIFSNDTFKVSHIPCRVVYDAEVGASSLQPGLETRRCGLQFSKLSEMHTVQLRVLMDTYAEKPSALS